MPRLIKKSFNSAKLKAFAFFVIVASVFWILTKFAKPKTANVVADVVYTNVPDNKILETNNPKELTFKLNANTFEHLYYKIKKPKIAIDVSTFFNAKNNNALLNQAQLIDLISNQINDQLNIEKIEKQRLTIKFSNLNSKKVPVNPQLTLRYKNGFNAVDPLKITPDSITISGAKTVLDTITEIKTIKITKENIEKPLQFNATLISLDTIKVTLSNKSVIISQNVSEFAQKVITVPITLVNAPANETIRLLPKVVKITFNAPISQFNNITASSFVVECDFKKRNKEDNFIVPEIIQYPNGIIDMELDTKKIDLLIFK